MTTKADVDASGRSRSRVAAAALTYGTNIGAAVLSLLNVLIVARVLGPSGRGDVAFVIAVITFTATLASCGIQEANANIGGVEVHSRASLATTSVALSLLFGAVAAAAVLALTTAFPAVGGDVDRVWLVIALTSIPAVMLKVFLQFLVQAEYGFAITNMAWIAGPLTTAVTNGGLALAGGLTVGSAVLAWMGGQTLGVAMLLVYIQRHSGFGRPDRVLARRMLGFGLKTHLGRSLTLGNYRVDQWFVGAMAGSRELGFYSVAVAWVEALYYIPGVLRLVQRPDIVRAGRAEAGRQTARVFRMALVLSTAVAVFLAVAAPILCTGIYGAEFSASVDDLRILSMAAFGIAALELLGGALIAQRRPLLSTPPIAIAFAVTMVLDIALIPSHGGAGAAVATSAAWTAGGLAVAAVFSRGMGTRPFDLVPRPSDIMWMWTKTGGAVVGGLSRRARLS